MSRQTTQTLNAIVLIEEFDEQQAVITRTTCKLNISINTKALWFKPMI